jgi:hypothetical protein
VESREINSERERGGEGGREGGEGEGERERERERERETVHACEMHHNLKLLDAALLEQND